MISKIAQFKSNSNQKEKLSQREDDFDFVVAGKDDCVILAGKKKQLISSTTMTKESDYYANYVRGIGWVWKYHVYRKEQKEPLYEIENIGRVMRGAIFGSRLLLVHGIQVSCFELRPTEAVTKWEFLRQRTDSGCILGLNDQVAILLYDLDDHTTLSILQVTDGKEIATVGLGIPWDTSLDHSYIIFPSPGEVALFFQDVKLPVRTYSTKSGELVNEFQLRDVISDLQSNYLLSFDRNILAVSHFIPKAELSRVGTVFLNLFNFSNSIKYRYEWKGQLPTSNYLVWSIKKDDEKIKVALL
jgi:hypothetical protein